MFKKVLEYAGEHRGTTYKAAIVMIIGIVAYVVPFLFVYQIINPLLMHEELSFIYVAWRIGGIGFCLILYAIFYIWGLSLSHRAAYNTLKNLRISLQEKMEKLPLGTIQEKGTGSIKKIFIDDIESIEILLAHALPEGIANFTIAFMTYIAMFVVDWKLALLCLSSMPIGMIGMGMLYKIGMKEMNAYYASAQKMNNTIVEYINGMEVVKVFNRDGESYHRFEKDVRGYRDFTLAWFKACWPWMALYNSILPCVALITLPVGSYFVLQGYSTLPNLVLILCMAFAIGSPLLRALGFMSTIPQINFKIESLEEMMNAAPLIQGTSNFNGKDHSISFENVHFAYEDEEVLHGITLSAKEGTLTALIGESGSGKSTLAKLLVHYYDVTSGTIKIGGQDIQEMSIEALNEEIAYVSQEQFLFNTTLLENIRIGNLHATDEEVMEAAKKAQCEELLQRLDKGIHTMAGDGGKQLSGGERQRISLARAILKNAPIIVLDEATAFMDPENEEKMNAAIAEVIKDKTVIVIAHRLHSIVHANQICVLKEGNIKALGTHNELLSDCEEYQKLWTIAKNSVDWKVASKERGEQ
ncbi:MAG: ABC transporter ATP-binding protein [Coprobacillaceae bacterium]